MKFFAVLAAIIAVASASGSYWTVQQLGDALNEPHLNPAFKPVLEATLNQVMDAIWAGHDIEYVTVTLPSSGGAPMTLHELSEAIQNPATDPALLPYYEAALNEMMEALISGQPASIAVVPAPAMELHHYTLEQLSNAIQDPKTNPELLPYLKDAMDTMMDNLFHGGDMVYTIIAVPAGLKPVEAPVQVPAEVILPAEVIPAEIIPAEIVSPTPVQVPSAASPLVQIVINVNQAASAAPTPVALPAPPKPDVVIDPVQIVDQAPAPGPKPPKPVVDPVQIVDQLPVVIDPVQIVDQLPVVIDPVQIVDVAPVEPVIIGTPVIPYPIQVVDVAPVPEVQPIIIGTPVMPAPAMTLPEDLN